MSKRTFTILLAFLMLTSLLYVACNTLESTPPKIVLPDPDPGNGDIQLLPGFGAVVAADTVGPARHLVVRENGDVYVRLRRPNADGKGTVALRDTSGDGRADLIQYFDTTGGTGMDLHKGYLYFSSRTQVFRAPLAEDELVPSASTETLITFPDSLRTGHSAKSFTFDHKGNIYVNLGSRSNACQIEARSPLSPGKDPCPELPARASIWKFSLDRGGQLLDDGEAYAIGIRNSVALDWNLNTDKLYAVQHGRDDLHRFWPDLYTEEQNRDLPAEEFLEIEAGDDYGWPYCYYDQFQNKKLLAPEYGGDGQKQGRCEGIKDPIVTFPGHMGPNDLVFYNGDQYPERYKNGAFIAFHGSWNRLGFNQAGFSVYFVPFKDGKPAGNWEVFASGFEGPNAVKGPNNARFRPTGLAVGPDGSLYVADSRKGRIWRIMYYGEDILPEGTQSIDMVADASEDATPVEVPAELQAGKAVYDQFCQACHMADGAGVSGMNPPLAGTDWVLGDKERIIKVILNGLSDPVEINGEIYQNVMAAHNFLNDQQVADVLTYVRKSFGNNASEITATEVQTVRKQQQESESD